MTTPIYNPGQPYMLPIPAGGLTPGRITHITGIVAPTSTSIVVKLQSGPYGDPNDEIGLCIYGRVAEGVIGLNAFTRAAGWGQEQPFRTPALVRGQPVEFTILSDPYVFKIAVNRQHLAEYRHVMNPALVNHLNIISPVNDFTVTYIWVQDPNQPAPPPMGQTPGMAPGMAPAMAPGMAPGVTPQYPGQPAGQYGMGHMAGAAAMGAVAGGAVGVMGGMAYSKHKHGRRGSGSSSSSDDDHGSFFNSNDDGVQHTYVHHVHHHEGGYDRPYGYQDNNDDEGDINININIEGNNDEPNVAALNLEDNEGEKGEEDDSSSSSSSSEEEPEEEPEEEEGPEEEEEEEEEEPEEEEDE